MSGGYFAIGNTSGENQQSIVPYFGRNGVVAPTDVAYLKAVEALIDVSTSIAKIAPSKSNHLWATLSEELGKFSQGFLDPDVPKKRYQIDLLVETVIPYLQEAKSQLHTQPSRLNQIQAILRVLSEGDVSQGTKEHASHPCHSLKKIETIIVSINREGGLWKSKLSKALEDGVSKQWAPIIADHQQALLSIGGKLCILGLVEAVGRPIIMLYPLFVISKELLKISSEIDVKKKVSMNSIMQIIKMAVMLFCVVQLLGILSMYTGLGYTCFGLGCGALLVSSNDELTKSSVPMMAPHMVSISLFLDQLYKLEGAAVGALSRLGTHTNTQATATAENDNSRVSSSSSSSSSAAAPAVAVAVPISSRVTELSAEDNDDNNDSVFSPLHTTNITTPNIKPSAPPQQMKSSTTSSSNNNTLDNESIKNIDKLKNKDDTNVKEIVEKEKEKVTEVKKEVEKEETDYVFAELDVYSSLTARDGGTEDEKNSNGLRQRRSA
jgi:hypothetical protein